MAYTKTFTIFTPTFNRANVLHRVFDSLQAQTFKDFEWLVIDDGSVDNTRELVMQWKKKARFPIRYFYQENSGVHFCFNLAVRHANGELFLYSPSDDVLLPNALDRLFFHWQGIPREKKFFFSGVTCLCKYPDGRIIGSVYPENVFDSDSLETFFRYAVWGEKFGFQRTSVMKKFPFPEFKGLKFVPEGIVWNRIAKKYKTRFVNEVLRIYFVDQEDSLCRSKKILSSNGSALFCKECLNYDFNWFFFNPGYFFWTFIGYGRYSLHSGYSIKQQFFGLNSWLKRIIFSACLPAAFILAVSDRLKKRI